MSEESKSYHMDLETFRRNGYAAVDWVVEYLRDVESYPVSSRVRPGEVRDRLPASPPRTGEDFEAMLRDVRDVVLPGVTHWQSPKFFGFFPANGSPPAILGELISAGLGVQGMMWATSPACTEVEAHVMDWLVEMLDLPGKFASRGGGGGVIQDSASSATLCALIAARERASGGECNRGGGDGRLVAYASTQAHSSIEKACMVAGIGSRNLRPVEVDERFAMRPEALAARVRRDRDAGLKPFFVCASAGTTSSLALDPIAPLARICAEHGLWLHVDAAMAGTAAVCPEFRFVNDGVDGAHSYTFNPHKWMFTNFDCNAFFVAERGALTGALGVLPEYLRNEASESGAVIDYRDWQIPLGRRFRALKLWFVIRHYGVEGLRHHVRRHVELARRFRQWVERSEDFEAAADCPLNLVCFRHRAGDEVSRRVLAAVNDTGEAYLTHTVLNGRFALRMSIGQTHTEQRHVTRVQELLQDAAAGTRAV